MQYKNILVFYNNQLKDEQTKETEDTTGIYMWNNKTKARNATKIELQKANIFHTQNYRNSMY
jgi:hypothetical protein